MSEKGWIKLHRKLLEWEWYDDLPARVLFLHLLLKTERKCGRYHGHEIPAGSCVTGLHKLSEQTGLTYQQTRTALEKLRDTSEITIKATNKFSIISITNWSEYQENNKRITNEQQTDNKRITTSKEVKKKEDKNNNISTNVDALLRDAVDVYHRVTEFSRIRKLTPQRKQKLRKRLREDCENDLRQWEGVCARAAASPFLNGNNDRAWTADIDWFLRPESITRLMEGKYDERPGKKQKSVADTYLAGFGAAINEKPDGC